AAPGARIGRNSSESSRAAVTPSLLSRCRSAWASVVLPAAGSPVSQMAQPCVGAIALAFQVGRRKPGVEPALLQDVADEGEERLPNLVGDVVPDGAGDDQGPPDEEGLDDVQQAVVAAVGEISAP